MADGRVEALARAADSGTNTSRSNISAMISAGQAIEFYNPRGLYGGTPIIFPAFITSFSDNIQAEFGDTATYGRMDPIYTYKHTRRTINFSIDIPADDKDSAIDNFQKVKRLQSLLYPSYEKSGPARVISAAPLFQIKFNNLIEDPTNNNGKLLGVIPSIDFTPELDPGMFYDDQNNKFYPKLIKLSVTFNPLHTGPAVGWDSDSTPVRAFSGTGAKDEGGAENDDPVTAGSGVMTDDVTRATGALITAGASQQMSMLPEYQGDE